MADFAGDVAGKLGALDARMTAMESRMGRHEDFMGGQIASLSSKMDTQNGSINAKLDALIVQVAQGAGGLKLGSLLWTSAGVGLIAFVVGRVFNLPH